MPKYRVAMGMGKIANRGAPLLGILFLLGSCQEVFTSNIFTWAAADPSDLNGEQLESYAKEVAKSGDRDAMTEAYDALITKLPENAEDDVELYILASDLGFGKAGFTDALTEAAKMFVEKGSLPQQNELSSEVKELIDNTIDEEALAAAVEQFTAAANTEGASEKITDSQYINAAVASMLLVFNDMEAGDTVDENDERLKTAEEWADKAGYDLSTLPINN